jgi:hypothetical protein
MLLTCALTVFSFLLATSAAPATFKHNLNLGQPWSMLNYHVIIILTHIMQTAQLF